MLIGTLKVKDAKVNETLIKDLEYNVVVRDTFDSTQLYIMPPKNFLDAGDGRYYYDVRECEVEVSEGVKERKLCNVFNELKQYEGALCLEERRLDIKKSSHKYKTNILNEDFVIKLSALLRYVLTCKGKSTTVEGIRKVELDNNLGSVEYKMGVFSKLSIDSPYFTILCEESDIVPLNGGEFRELQSKDKWGNLSPIKIETKGIKLAEELLGFPYIPPIQKVSAEMLGVYETIDDVIEANSDKNIDWIRDRKYVIVDKHNLEEVIEEFRRHRGFIAYDSETSGLDITFKSREGLASQLVGIVLSKEIGTGYYFPLQHKLFENLCDGDHHYFMEKYMKDILEKKLIVTHNASFDWKVAYIYGINTNVVYDTMLAFSVTKKYEDSSFETGLKSLAKTVFGLDMLDLSDFVYGGDFKTSNIGFWDLPYELVRQYAPADADMTLSLMKYLEDNKMLARYTANKVFKLEINFAKVVGYSEFYGYRVDREKEPMLRKELDENIEKYEGELFKIAGEKFNPKSPPQLMAIMYDKLGIELVENERTTKKASLNVLSKMEKTDGTLKYPFADILLKYRQNEKLYSGFVKRLNEFATDDGYISPSVFAVGTTTGRCSVKEPNYQSYNDTVKKYIVPRPDFIMVDSDFSQIEARVLSSMAGQHKLMAEFDDPDLDYHQYQASRMFNVPYAQVSKELRQQSKGVNFGLPYGMENASLGKAIFGVKSAENTVKAGILRKKFFEGQEKIEAFFEYVRSNGVKNNFTSTMFGRRRYYDRGKYNIGDIRRQAGNHVIQGTSADIYKLAVCRLFNRVVKEGWLGKVLFNAFVHDEILMEVHKDIDMYYFIKLWREEFEVDIDKFCKLYSGIGFGFCWYDAKKEDFPPQYIDELIRQHEEGKEWNYDLEGFRKNVYAEFKEFKIKRVGDYIQAKDNQNEVIKPAMNAMLSDVLGDVVSDYDKKGVLQEVLDTLGIKKFDKKKFGSLKDNIALYCHRFGIDNTDINILSVDDVDTEEEVEKKEVSKENQYNIVEVEDTVSPVDIALLTGVYLDEENERVYMVDKPMVLSGVATSTINYLFSKGVFKQEARYKVVLVKSKDEQVVYNCYIKGVDYDDYISPLYSKLSKNIVVQRG